MAPNGKFVYVAENVGDSLAVVNAATGEVVQRFPTDHYPYGVILSADGHVFVSAWGGTTISEFRVLEPTAGLPLSDELKWAGILQHWQ